MKTLNEFAKEIMDNKNNPHVLAELQVEMAGKYAMLSEIAKDLQIEKAEFTNTTKFGNEKVMSDTAAEAKWRITEGGQKEIKLKFELKALEKLMSACKSSIVVSSYEARNIF